MFRKAADGFGLVLIGVGWLERWEAMMEKKGWELTADGFLRTF